MAQQPKPAIAPKPPVVSDALKIRIWKAIAQVREIEIAEKDIAARKEKAIAEAQSALAAAKSEGFQLDNDLNNVPVPKAPEVKK